MKKVLPLLFLVIPLISIGQAKVSGVVTYYFNQYQGDKPDVGAKVYLLDSSAVPDINIKVVDTLHVLGYASLALSYAQMAGDNLVIAKKYEGKKRYKDLYDKFMGKYDEYTAKSNEFSKLLEDYKMSTKEQIEAIDRKVYNMNVNFEKGSERVVDGSGRFVYDNVPPGIYYILIRSNGRKGSTMSEIQGNVYYKRIEVKTAEVAVNNRFS